MRRESKNPPSIASLKAAGVRGFYATCRDCRRSTPMVFDVLALPDERAFPDIGKGCRFRCKGCGSAQAAVTPDWREYKAPGMGRM
jgi:hypothetical protein